MSKVSKDQRDKLYKDHNTQLFISKFVSGELSKLEPVFDPKNGYGYPVVNEIVGDSSSADEFLESLFGAGILDRELYDKITYCPYCNSANISIHYCCPHCKSFNIKKSALIEHISCGYIEIEERFRQGDKLVCPRCRKELIRPDVDFHKAGVWCACNECDKSFDIAVPAHFCRDCRTSFTFEDSVYKDVYSYSLTSDAAKEMTAGLIMIAPILEFLQNCGFKVESPGFLKGKSGASHKFDITASPAGVKRNITAIDLATSNDDVVSEQSVIAMFAKIYDVSPDKAYLIAIPKMNENGKKLATLYKIELIEAKDQKGVIRILEAYLKK
jgi:transcription elongation factor Elf1